MCGVPISAGGLSGRPPGPDQSSACAAQRGLDGLLELVSWLSTGHEHGRVPVGVEVRVLLPFGQAI